VHGSEANATSKEAGFSAGPQASHGIGTKMKIKEFRKNRKLYCRRGIAEVFVR
jgi:hypothetical protein